MKFLLRYLMRSFIKEVKTISGNTCIYGIKTIVFYNDYIARHVDEYLSDTDKYYIKAIISGIISKYELECIRRYSNDVEKLQNVFKRIINYFGREIDRKLSSYNLPLTFNNLYFLISKVDEELSNELGLWSRLSEALEEKLDDLEDIYLSEQVMHRIKAGKEKTYKLDEVIKELNLKEK